MSTRCTIAYDDTFHLYQECFENDNVYLKLEGKGWAAAIETATVDWRDDDNASPTAHVRIDVALWRKIVEGWLASSWGKDPTYDHRKFEINTDFIQIFTKKTENKEDEENP